jgi:hypothetical protein
MSATSHLGHLPTDAVVGSEAQGPAYQGYQILHFGFVALPAVMGADKFFHVLVNWDQYLAPLFVTVLGGASHDFMLVVGVIEIVAALIVAVKPRIGAYVVAAWLAGIVVDLLLTGRFFDVALRDFGLLLGALALARLAAVFDHLKLRRLLSR